MQSALFLESTNYRNSIVQCCLTSAPCLVWRRRVGRSETSRTVLRNELCGGGPTSLTTALDRNRRGDKSIWEWMEVFIVLFAIALFTIVFSVVQCCSQQQIESQRAQDAALQAYLDQMSRLLLEKDLRNSEEGSEVRTSPPSFLVATFC